MHLPKPALYFTRDKQVIYHTVAWLVFIAYEVSFVTLIRRPDTQISILHNYIVPYIINIALFYFHALVTMRIGFGKTSNHILLFILLLIVELIFYLAIMQVNDWAFAGKETPFSIVPDRLKFIRQLWRGIYFLIFSSAFWLIQRNFINEKKLKEAERTVLLRQQEKKELEIQLVSTQNAFLQSQINPHLLFNTLNFIHNEAQQVSSKAADAILILADMMRYSLTETKTDGKVAVEKEIGQIENIISLNQFRFSNKLCIIFEKNGNFENSRIIPLLLVPIAENLFKYAELRDEAHPVKIVVLLDANKIHFETFNKKRKIVNFSSGGIGIDNVKKRLDSYYAGRYTLNIVNSEDSFAVNLEIQL